MLSNIVYIHRMNIIVENPLTPMVKLKQLEDATQDLPDRCVTDQLPLNQLEQLISYLREKQKLRMDIENG